MIIILDQQYTVITAIALCKTCHNLCEPRRLLSVLCSCLGDELSFFHNKIALKLDFICSLLHFLGDSVIDGNWKMLACITFLVAVIFIFKLQYCHISECVRCLTHLAFYFHVLMWQPVCDIHVSAFLS